MTRATVVCAEFTEWAAQEAERIARGESQPYHAVLCDPPYGLEFMGKDWDRLDVRQPGDATFHKSGVGPFDRSKVRHSVSGGYGGNTAIMQEIFHQWGEAILLLLYPGALVFMFGGTRTWHRLAAGMEDAGFQLFDTLMWLHGQGFPKAQAIDALIDKKNDDEREVIGSKIGRPGYSLSEVQSGTAYELSKHRNAQKECEISAPSSEQSAPWSGHKTAALKPAWEPILCFRAPDKGKTYAELATEFGSGALNVDGGRLSTDGNVTFVRAVGKRSREQWRTGTVVAQVPSEIGRYPANLAFECICEKVEIVEAPVNGDVSGDEPSQRLGANGIYGEADDRRPFRAHRGKAVRHTNPDCPCYRLDAQAGERKSSGLYSPHGSGENIGGLVTDLPGLNIPGSMFDDAGGPSRFFYCAKASRSEREEGLQDCEPTKFGQSNAAKAAIARGEEEYGTREEFGANIIKSIRNDHPTVKPIDLARWLATLLLPPDSVKPRRLLNPFCGSGSEAIGALLAGFDEVVCVEQDKHYAEIAQARIAHWAELGVELLAREGDTETRTAVTPAQRGLFDGEN